MGAVVSVRRDVSIELAGRALQAGGGGGGPSPQRGGVKKTDPAKGVEKDQSKSSSSDVRMASRGEAARPAAAAAAEAAARVCRHPSAASTLMTSAAVPRAAHSPRADRGSSERERGSAPMPPPWNVISTEDRTYTISGGVSFLVPAAAARSNSSSSTTWFASAIRECEEVTSTHRPGPSSAPDPGRVMRIPTGTDGAVTAPDSSGGTWRGHPRTWYIGAAWTAGVARPPPTAATASNTEVDVDPIRPSYLAPPVAQLLHVTNGRVFITGFLGDAIEQRVAESGQRDTALAQRSKI
mmetsp:Transcript_35062/g.69070  ORF Transcript_35062/g.69070 Transcript_35062/m.69070 type:complete len:295 (-) Transcript_35062:17-901(-)